MRFDIFGFRQDKLIEYDLGLEDILLLDYIWDMEGSPTMQHILYDGVPYVWLMHDRILSDLPILNISNRSLINYLNKLKDKELLDVRVVHNDSLRGSKSFYAITKKCEELRYDQVQDFSVSQRPSAKNCSSDISISKDTNNISKENNTNIQQSLFNTNNINNKEVRNKEDTYKEKGQKFVDDYNRICKSLPRCQRLNAKRTKAITRILKNYSEEEILTVFEKLENSDWCTGKVNGWKADIDFLLKEDKFDKILEGSYDNRKTKKNFETISEGEKYRLTPEQKEELRKAVERGELEEY